MEQRILEFTRVRKIAYRQVRLRPPRRDEVIVRVNMSAISAGTELLVYNGEIPEGMVIDPSFAELRRPFSYPVSYGYSTVGTVIEAGRGCRGMAGGRVFSFRNHQTCFRATAEEVFIIPTGVTDEDALFFPNMETACNLVMDARPIVGERMLILGQGVVGLLTTGICGRFPLESLITVDRYERRRKASLLLGAHRSITDTDDAPPEDYDCCLELTGDPRALDQALASTGRGGRIIVGSWYGKKRAPFDLGGKFHRSRVTIRASQVSSIAPELNWRWSRERRYRMTWEMIRTINPGRLVSHRYPFERAAEAFELLNGNPQEALQVLLTY